MPNGDGTGFTEPVGNNYARKSVTNNTTNWPNAATVAGVTTKANGALITFANPTGAWGPVLAWGAFLAASGGTPRYFNELETTVYPTATAIPVEFDVGFLALIFKGET